MTKATVGILVLALGCGGKKEQPPVAVGVAADAAAAPTVDAAPPPFLVWRTHAQLTKTVEVALPDGAKCPRIEWRPDAKTLRIARCGDRSLASQAPILRDMVSYLRTTDALGEDFHVTGVGDFLSYPELARRFVAYAKTHPYRDGIHAWVKQAANSGDMMPELAVIFQRMPVLISTEKCWAGRATDRTAEGAFVRDAGGTGTAQIPLGCSMMVFELARP